MDADTYIKVLCLQLYYSLLVYIGKYIHVALDSMVIFSVTNQIIFVQWRHHPLTEVLQEQNQLQYLLNEKQ